ncbi:MAG: stage V sporulation protein SpoVM [Oscillospiraceae bacterium]|nr:stage V sporulation protein SpoVM [Oscillospiraceae bacterium]
MLVTFPSSVSLHPPLAAVDSVTRQPAHNAKADVYSQIQYRLHTLSARSGVMKIVVFKSPRFLSGILKAVFKI